jgi:hypothetical protein
MGGRKKLTHEEAVESARKRFEKYSKLNPETGCVEWVGCLATNGYGQIAFKNKLWRAHRLSFMLAGNELIDGLEICHTCNNRKCINPNHLRQDTSSSNHIDKSKAGNHPLRKLSDNEVLEIRKLYVKGSREFSTHKLAKKYGVFQKAIYLIVTGKTYKWIGE